jgi:hypothetical protein
MGKNVGHYVKIQVWGSSTVSVAGNWLPNYKYSVTMWKEPEKTDNNTRVDE